MIITCDKCGKTARYPDKSILICPGCGFAVKYENHKRCPFCGALGKSEFKLNGWRVECSNRHTVNCPVNMRTHYCDSEEEAWKLWDTRVV